MKNFMMLLGLLFPFFLMAQQGTTLDEYRYLTKGYAYQQEMGLGAGKAGYSVGKMFTASNGVEFYSLIMEDQKLVKGVLVVVKNGDKAPIYLGLPTNNADLELRQMADDEAKEKLNLKAKETFDIAMQEFTMFQLSGQQVEIIASQMSAAPENGILSQPKRINTENPNTSKTVEEYNTIVPLKTDREEMTERSGTINTKNVAPTPSSTRINNNVITNHNFDNRKLITPPTVYGQNPKKGTVVVKMCIDINGKVKSAKFTQRGSTTFDSKLKKMAIDAAKASRFSAGLEAEECGTMTFKFTLN